MGAFMPNCSPRMLLDLLDARTITELDEIQQVLDGASRATAFRYLKQIPYQRSCNYNGRYYTRDDPERYDRHGLFCYKGVLFSRDGTLGDTVVRMIREAEAGRTQRELREMLRVRVQTFLLQAIREGAVDRERVDAFFVYLNTNPDVRQSQLKRRRELISAATAAQEVTDDVVIQVLLTLIRHPDAKAADVVRHLHGQSPPVTLEHVRVVFDRYDLDNIGEKGGPSIF